MNGKFYQVYKHFIILSLDTGIQGNISGPSSGIEDLPDQRVYWRQFRTGHRGIETNEPEGA